MLSPKSVQRLHSEASLLKRKSSLLLPELFGAPPYRVQTKLSLGELTLELAHKEMPYTTLFFLRQVHARLWNGQKVIRNAGHVVQMDPRGPPGSRKRFVDEGLNSVGKRATVARPMGGGIWSASELGLCTDAYLLI